MADLAACPRCGAAVKEICHTPSGRPMYDRYHVARAWAFRNQEARAYEETLRAVKVSHCAP